MENLYNSLQDVMTLMKNSWDIVLPMNYEQNTQKINTHLRRTLMMNMRDWSQWSHKEVNPEFRVRRVYLNVQGKSDMIASERI